MKFWLIEDGTGETIGCEITYREAKASAQSYVDDYSIRWIEVPVSAESIRRLLGNHGGYATAGGRAHGIGEEK